VNVHESVLSWKLVFWMGNWKHVIKYDLYIKFPRIFAHNVQMCAKFCCKNFSDVCQVFRILHHCTVLRGTVFFCGHAVQVWYSITHLHLDGFEPAMSLCPLSWTVDYTFSITCCYLPIFYTITTEAWGCEQLVYNHHTALCHHGVETTTWLQVRSSTCCSTLLQLVIGCEKS